MPSRQPIPSSNQSFVRDFDPNQAQEQRNGTQYGALRMNLWFVGAPPPTVTEVPWLIADEDETGVQPAMSELTAGADATPSS
jgi:hypothetical protein